eukprot:COSAG02_NODE_207_length_29119_cov_41.071365_27_plen_52_part_00
MFFEQQTEQDIGGHSRQGKGGAPQPRQRLYTEHVSRQKEKPLLTTTARSLT